MANSQCKLTASSTTSSFHLQSEVFKEKYLEKELMSNITSQAASSIQGKAATDNIMSDCSGEIEEYDSINELERNFRLAQCEYEIAKVERDLKSAQRRQSTRLRKSTMNRSIKINGVSERNGSYSHMLKELSSLISEK